jgi:hypothetical protein
MQLKTVLNKSMKILGIIIVSVLIIISMAQLWLIVWGGDKVKSEMQERIHYGSDGLYHFDAENVRLSLFGISIAFKNAILKPNIDRYEEMKGQGDADKRLYEFHIASLKLSGINILRLLRNKELRTSGFVFNSPVIKIYSHNDVTPEKEDEKAKFTLYSLFSSRLELVEINSIKISDGAMKMIEVDGDSLTTFEIFNLNTDFSEFLIDSSHTGSGKKLFSAKKMNFNSDSLLIVFENGLYNLTIREINSTSENNSILLTGIQLEPQVAKFDFAHRYGYENDRINLLVDEITLEHISMVEMLQYGKVNAGKMVIKKFNMHAFRDKRLKLANVYRKLPQEMLRDLDLPIKIDTLQMVNSRIAYEEFPDMGDEAGNIFFSDVNAKIFNITNEKDSAAEANIKIVASGYVYGKSRIDANFNIPVFHKDNVFYFSGTLSEADATTFNEMSIPVAGVEIVSATIQKMEFNAQANTTHSQGTMKLYYDNLKIKIRDRESGRSKGIQSFLANLLVVKNSNPNNNEFREGEMSFERDTRKAITNFCWKTILSGMKSSIGMGSEVSNEDE